VFIGRNGSKYQENSDKASFVTFFRPFFNLFNKIQIKNPVYGLNKKINPELYRGLSSI
jgi:hypothetical protein